MLSINDARAYSRAQRVMSEVDHKVRYVADHDGSREDLHPEPDKVVLDRAHQPTSSTPISSVVAAYEKNGSLENAEMEFTDKWKDKPKGDPREASYDPFYNHQTNFYARATDEQGNKTYRCFDSQLGKMEFTMSPQGALTVMLDEPESLPPIGRAQEERRH